MSHRRSDRGPWEVTADTTLTLRPIGVVRSTHSERYRAPRQPEVAERHPASIVLFPGHNFEAALADLDGMDFVWVVFWFHRNDNWRPKVLPPRGPRVRRGVFATRSPHRPNPVGLSLVRLVKVRGRTIDVADVDLLDGTPVLDLKPYLPYAEAHPDARAGWLDAVVRDDDAGAATRFTVEWSPLAKAQAEWLEDTHGVELRAVVDPVLSRDPTPHPYRRVERWGGAMRVSVRSWRVLCAVEGERVSVTAVASGYPPEAVSAEREAELEDGAAHRGFHARWPVSGG